MNRRRPNYARMFLKVATVVLAVEILTALLFSPRLAVREVSVVGNQSIPAAQIYTKSDPLLGQNLLRYPIGLLEKELLKEPTFQGVSVQRVWPNRIMVRVDERQPWASVRTAEGQFYTIDEKLIPFRKTKGAEVGLPRLALAPLKGVATTVSLGKKMTAPGLSEVSQCLEWAKKQTDFPMDFVEIDPHGKLCFNRVGGTQIRLGSAVELPEKLNALGLLMQKYDVAQAAYVNLYAYDAPAVMPRDAVNTASARTHSSNSSSSSRASGTEAIERTLEQP